MKKELDAFAAGYYGKFKVHPYLHTSRCKREKMTELHPLHLPLLHSS